MTSQAMALLLTALDALQGPVIEGLLKISAILLIALAALALLRRQSAAARHWLLAAAIACALAMPALTLVLPSWHLAAAGFSATPALADSLARRFALSTTTDAGITVDMHADAAALRGDGAAAGQAADDAARARTAGAAAPLTPRAVVMASLVAVWLVGVAINLSVLLVGLKRLASLGARAQRLAGPDDAWHALASEMARGYGLRRPVRLLQSDHPTSLFTWGCVRPSILLPVSASTWTEARRRVVLAHELAHIARGDWAAQIAAELLRCITWCTPLAWIAARRLRAESEQACDDAVLGRGVDAPEYAAHLVALARAFNQRRDTWSPALGMVRQSAFERRIRAMLNSRLNRTPVTLAARVAIALAFGVVTLPIAALAAETQGTTASLAAVVRSPLGKPLADVAVTLTQSATQKVHEAKSDQAGRVEFADLPAGAYTVTIKQMGFRPLTEPLTLAGGKRLERDLALTLGTVQETINVRGASTGPPKVTPPEEVRKYASAKVDAKPLQPPSKIRHVTAVYPQAQHDAGVKGTVVIQAQIAKDGSVKNVKVTKSVQPELDKAAMDSVRQWLFTPTRLDGVAVDTDMTVSITFEP